MYTTTPFRTYCTAPLWTRICTRTRKSGLHLSCPGQRHANLVLYIFVVVGKDRESVHYIPILTGLRGVTIDGEIQVLMTIVARIVIQAQHLMQSSTPESDTVDHVVLVECFCRVRPSIPAISTGGFLEVLEVAALVAIADAIWAGPPNRVAILRPRELDARPTMVLFIMTAKVHPHWPRRPCSAGVLNNVILPVLHLIVLIHAHFPYSLPVAEVAFVRPALVDLAVRAVAGPFHIVVMPAVLEIVIDAQSQHDSSVCLMTTVIFHAVDHVVGIELLRRLRARIPGIPSRVLEETVQRLFGEWVQS